MIDQEQPAMLPGMESVSQETPAPAQQSEMTKDGFVLQLMYALTAPFIMDQRWVDPDLIKTHKDELLITRLATVREIFEHRQCSEIEAMLFLSTASLVAPLRGTWFNIYMWLFFRWTQRKHPENTPERLFGPDHHVPAKLNAEEERELARFRNWIFETQVKQLKAKIKGEKAAEASPPNPEEQAEQAPLF